MKKRKAGIGIFVIVLIITAVRVKSMDSHRISGRILAENIAGPGMLRLVEQSMQARARKTSVTEIAVKERKHPQAALTFDDGPDIRYTPLLLDGLKERNVRVSFFLLGEKVEQYPELVERMQNTGASSILPANGYCTLKYLSEFRCWSRPYSRFSTTPEKSSVFVTSAGVSGHCRTICPSGSAIMEFPQQVDNDRKQCNDGQTNSTDNDQVIEHVV